MSRRGAVPLLVAVGVGVAAGILDQANVLQAVVSDRKTGYYQWMPLWNQSEINRLKAEE